MQLREYACIFEIHACQLEARSIQLDIAIRAWLKNHQGKLQLPQRGPNKHFGVILDLHGSFLGQEGFENDPEP